MNVFNPFHANLPVIYPLEKSENLWFSDIFRGYRNRKSVWSGLRLKFWQYLTNCVKMYWRASIYLFQIIVDALCDLVSFVQFKRREKHPRRSLTFNKSCCNFIKVTPLHGCFSRFLNCTNGTKLLKVTKMGRSKAFIYNKRWTHSHTYLK